MQIKIEIHEAWHAGTGKGEGPAADALIVKNPDGLPYFPGRSLKGILREASELAEKAGKLPAGRSETLFGSSSSSDSPNGTRRFETKQGLLILSSAELGETKEKRLKWQKWARGNPAVLNWVGFNIASTAIDEDGVVKDKSLRLQEFAAPMTLYAQVRADEVLVKSDDGSWAKDLKEVLPLVRALGMKRNRGFGRCTLTLEGGIELEKEVL